MLNANTQDVPFCTEISTFGPVSLFQLKHGKILKCNPNKNSFAFCSWGLGCEVQVKKLFKWKEKKHKTTFTLVVGKGVWEF